ncbi:hypothetical protein CR513_00281, partial [Mucuna pruriens]
MGVDNMMVNNMGDNNTDQLKGNIRPKCSVSHKSIPQNQNSYQQPLSLRIALDFLKSTGLWVLLAYHLPGCPSLRHHLEPEWPSTKDMRCPSNPFFFAKSLMFRIMFRNGWRLNPPKQMMQKFSVPKALVGDQMSHLCNITMSTLLEKYGVVHQVATAYHPQTNVQARNQTTLAKDGEPQQKRLEPTIIRHSLGSQDSISNLVRNVSLSDSLRQSMSPPD